jgi:hypothetical protein
MNRAWQWVEQTVMTGETDFPAVKVSLPRSTNWPNNNRKSPRMQLLQTSSSAKKTSNYRH